MTGYNQEWLTIDHRGTNLPRSIQSSIDNSLSLWNLPGAPFQIHYFHRLKRCYSFSFLMILDFIFLGTLFLDGRADSRAVNHEESPRMLQRSGYRQTTHTNQWNFIWKKTLTRELSLVFPVWWCFSFFFQSGFSRNIFSIFSWFSSETCLLEFYSSGSCIRFILFSY